MKKLFLFCIAALTLAACTPKTPAEKAMERLLDEEARLEAYFAEEHSEAEADSVFRSFIFDALSAAEENLHTDVHYYVVRELYYFLDIPEKAELIDCLTPEELENVEGLARKAYAFNHERQTQVGMPYIDFGALTPAGDSLYVHDLVGRKDFLIIDFWASWCRPCRESMPELKALLATYAERVDVLGVSLDENQTDWTGCIRSLGLDWYHMSDLQGWQSQAAETYGICGIPATVVLDREGRILARELDDLLPLLQE